MKHSVVSIIILCLVSISNEFVCDKTPKNADLKKKNDGRYVIEIDGNPETYLPNKNYTVILKSNPQRLITYFFTHFTLVVETEGAQAGELIPIDFSIASFTTKCPNAIVETNSLGKSNVEILWTAPPSGNGDVAFKATVYESNDSWFADDDTLTKIIAEELENPDEQPPHMEKCSLCSEAKYELAFQGMWTRNTHPKDYPANMWNTKLGELIGASHKNGVSFWNYNELANQSLKLLAEEGSTQALEDELKELVKNDDVRTIIKARELSYPNITGTSYTVFRVDAQHHLISLVSKITPSPDWIVGVANLELCQETEWVQSRTINLYPWDIGTDSGSSYNSPDEPTEGEEVIKQITVNLPGYPFHNPNETSMKPIAQLRVTRQKVYEKRCDECEMSNWGDWSSCSDTTCEMTRDRQLQHPENEVDCSKNGPLQLQETVACQTSSECTPDPNCANITWSDWSSCNVSCGDGFKTRQKSLPSEDEGDKPSEEATCFDTVQCIMPPCEDDLTTTTSLPLSVENQELDVDCRMSKWSTGPCIGEPCKKGRAVRTRTILVHPRNRGKPCRSLKSTVRCDTPCSTPGVVDCQMGNWSEWSPCTKTCGPSAVQIRTRKVEVYAQNGGQPCGPRKEEKECPLPFTCEDIEWESIRSNN